MNEEGSQKLNTTKSLVSDTSGERKPYSPPRILSQDKLEAVAGPCSKATPRDCNQQPVPSS